MNSPPERGPAATVKVTPRGKQFTIIGGGCQYGKRVACEKGLTKAREKDRADIFYFGVDF